jgi:hypothetical protein
MIGLLLSLLGCTPQGAGDPFPDDPRLELDQVRQCVAGETPDLGSGEGPSLDRSASGRLSGAPASFGAAVPHMVALDYSGSMFGGYERSSPSPEASQCGWSGPSRGRGPNAPFYWEQSEFRGLLEQGPLASIGATDPVQTAVFGREVLLLDGASAVPFRDGSFSRVPQPTQGRGAVLDALTSVDGGSLPARPWQASWKTPGLWNESRMAEVLDAAAWTFEQDARRDGVLWIVTDNIIDEGADELSEEAANNRAFYQKLKDDPRWQVVHAWPVSEGGWLCDSTLLVYGLYYSSRERLDEQAYAELSEARLDTPATTSGFARFANEASPSPGSPFKLKPDDLELIEPDFEGTVDCGGAKATGIARTCTARVNLENLLKHRRITGATLAFSGGRLDAWDRSTDPPQPVITAVPLGSGTVTAEALLEQPIEPGEDATIEVQLTIPPIETAHPKWLADNWVSARHPRFGMVGGMTVEIRGLRTEMAVDASELGAVYGVAALPEIFRDPNTDELDRDVCLMMTVDNPSYLSSMLLLGGLALGGLVFFGGGWLLKPTFRFVVVDGVAQEQLRLTRLLGAAVVVDGREVARARLSGSGRVKLVAVKPWRLTPKGGHWELQDRSDEFGTRRKLELRRRAELGSRASRRGDDF